MKQKNLTTLLNWERDEIEEVLNLAKKVKKDKEKYREVLKGKSLAMIFEKPSTRTRVSFTQAMWELGGLPIFLSSSDLQLGRGETIEDTARVLSRYVQAIMARVYRHQTIEELAKHSSVPVINGLSDLFHPCQVLADFQTIEEKLRRIKDIKLTYIGDGNNMAHSLMVICAKLGTDVTVISPINYMPNAWVVEKVKEVAKKSGSKVTITENLEEVKNSDVVVTDTWLSMGQEDPGGIKRKTFEPYRVTQKIMKMAKKSAIFMHCLPAHRGEEVDADVIDGPQSVIFDEAENRLHAQKAVLIYLLK